MSGSNRGLRAARRAILTLAERKPQSVQATRNRDRTAVRPRRSAPATVASTEVMRCGRFSWGDGKVWG